MGERSQRQPARRISPPPQPAPEPAPAEPEPMIVVGKWTAPVAVALWTATRDNIHDFAARLGISAGAIEDWKHCPDIIPTPTKQRALDKALEWADRKTLRRFALLVRGNPEVWVPDSLLPIGNGGGTDRRQASKTLGLGLVTGLAPVDTVERIADALEHHYVDAGLIGSLEAMTSALAVFSLQRPAGVLVRPARGHLATVLELLDEPMDPGDRERMTGQAAEVALLVGWISFDLNRRADARASFSLAESLAWEAGDGDVLARALASASLLPSATFRGGVGGDTKAAVKLADRAYALARNSAPLTRSWIAGRAGVEHAAAKHPNTSARLLEDAQRALEQAVASGEIGGVHYERVGIWDQPRLDGYRGTALTLLGRTGEADRLLSAALTQPLSDGRRVLLLSDLGLARLTQHPEQACADLAEAHHFATSARYPNGVRRILGVRARLDSRHADLDCVRELDERLGLRR